MADHTVAHTAGVNVYAILWRNLTTTGALQVWNTATSSWGTFSGGSMADYDWPSTELGTNSGIYATTFTDSVIDDATVITIEYRHRAGGTAAQTDAIIERYDWTYSTTLLRLVPPSFVAGQSAEIQATITKVGRTMVNHPADFAPLPVGASLAFAPYPLPSNWSLASGAYQSTGSPSVSQRLLKATSVLDMTHDWRLDFTTSSLSDNAALDLYVGVCQSPASINDISASLIGPSETNSSKTLFRAGFILRTAANYQTITTGSTNSTCTSAAGFSTLGTLNNSYYLVWNAAAKTLTLYNVAGSAVAAVTSTYAASLTDLSIGLVVNASDAEFNITVTPSGQGWTNNAPPTASTIASQVRTELTTELGRLDATVSSRNATTPPTVGAIADAVLDEALSGHTTAGTLGKAMGDTSGTVATNLDAKVSESGGAVDLTPVLEAIDALPTAPEFVTQLFATSTADSGAGKVGRALHYLVNSYASQGKFSTNALENAPAGEGGGGGGDPVAADVVDDSRTWFATDSQARNIITVAAPFSGTLALKPDLNPGTTIEETQDVTILDSEEEEVATTTYTRNRAKDRAHCNTEIATPGTYSVRWTVETVDGQELTTTGTLRVQ